MVSLYILATDYTEWHRFFTTFEPVDPCLTLCYSFRMVKAFIRMCPCVGSLP
jgi:hypothetical protein